MKNPEEIADIEWSNLSGKRAVVTGSTSGIGRETVLALGRLGADIVVHGRDQRAGEEVVKRARKDGAEAEFVRADFENPDEVHELARTVESGGGIDVLVNNAGGVFSGRRTTSLGVEPAFHVNHLAHYQLTAELVGSLSAGEGVRVVTVSSIEHRFAGFDLEAVEKPGRLPYISASRAYQRSKLANVLFAKELARRSERVGAGILSNSLHPGWVPGTGMNRSLPYPLSPVARSFRHLPFSTSVNEASRAVLYLVASKETEGISGKHFAGRETREPSEAAKDIENQRRLWEKSAQLLGIEEPLQA
jgi:NAD(P)-dependent dehydrogenase (short-subunit alcohol dehydrogenase family)